MRCNQSSDHVKECAFQQCQNVSSTNAIWISEAIIFISSLLHCRVRFESEVDLREDGYLRGFLIGQLPVSCDLKNKPFADYSIWSFLLPKISICAKLDNDTYSMPNCCATTKKTPNLQHKQVMSPTGSCWLSAGAWCSVTVQRLDVLQSFLLLAIKTRVK